MNNSNDKDDLRFKKLYELLGDEVNDIYKKDANDLFSDNNGEVFVDNTNKKKKKKKKKKHVANIEFVSPTPVPVDKEKSEEENNENASVDIISIEPVTLKEEKEEEKEKVEEKKVVNETVRNKVIINDDFLDDDIEVVLNGKNRIRNFFTKRNLTIILVLIFIFVCIVVIKAFYYGKKVDHYEEFFTVIASKEEEYTVVYDDQEIDSDTLKKMAASELINCINSKVDENNLPDGIKNIVNEINNYYNQSYDYFSFLYRDIYTGFTVSYNQNQNIFTASTIKGPTDLYIYEMASQGKVDLDEKLTYTGGYYNTGSGVLKNKSLNTKYDVRTLLQYSTVESDNAAHNMLMDKYGRSNMLNFWKEKGTTAIFTANNNWGVTNAHDASIYMQELYRFYVNDDEYGEAVMKNFMNAHPKFISGKNKYVVANKSGWSGTAIHDVSIIFADNPYIVVALSNLGTTDYYMSYFNQANDLAYRLHTEYWKYKMNQCNNIKQY